jgi:hypothetical protein
MRNGMMYEWSIHTAEGSAGAAIELNMAASCMKGNKKAEGEREMAKVNFFQGMSALIDICPH